MSDRRFDVVFLDAGGVLVQPDPAKVMARFSEIGVAVDDRLLFEAHFRGVHANDVAEAEPEVFAEYHQAYARHLGLEPGTAESDAVIDSLLDLWATTGLWTEPLPWAAAGLAAIAETGVPIIVVSNADGTVAELLRGTGLLQVGPGPGVEVAAIVDSGAVGVAKPDPAIFAIALGLAGVSAEQAVHVGDAYEYDVRGARAAGVHPVLVDPLGLRPDAPCDRITELSQVVALLSK